MPISFYSTPEDREAVEGEIKDTVVSLKKKDNNFCPNASHEALESLCQKLSDTLFEKTQRFSSRSPVLQALEAASKVGCYLDLYLMATGYLMLNTGGLLSPAAMKKIIFIAIIVHLGVLVATLVLMATQNARKLKMFNMIAMLRILRDEYMVSNDDSKFTDEMACRVMAANRFDIVKYDNNVDPDSKGNLFKVMEDGEIEEEDFSEGQKPDEDTDNAEEDSSDDDSNT